MKTNTNIDYPFREQGMIQTLALGIVLVVSNFIIFPIVYYLGYLVEVMSQTINGKETPPEITSDTVIEQCKIGIGATGIWIVYLSPLLIYGFMFFASAALGMGAAGHDETSRRIVTTGIVGGSVLTVIQLLITTIALPVSLSIYGTAKENAFVKSLSPKEIYSTVVSKHYITYLCLGLIIPIGSSLLLIAVSFVVGFILMLAGPVAILSPVIPIMAYLVLSPILVFSAHIIAKGIRKSKNSV